MILDTYEKIIKNMKRDLCNYINDPTNENASILYLSMGAIPFKYKEYEFWNDTDTITECREYMSMLFQLFSNYFQEYIKQGLEIDNIIKKGVDNE